MELFGRPFRVNAGMRVAITEVTSNGTSQAGRPIVGTNSYTDFLPSMNLVYEPIDDMLVRFAASKVMARPLLGNLSPSITAISVPNDGSVSGATLTVGNPQLNPFRSTNLDASVEWYFAPGGLISVAAFHKKIDSFPQTILFTAGLNEFADADTDFLSITAEGLNLTNQPSERYAYAGQEAVTQYSSSGPIYRIGARLRF